MHQHPRMHCSQPHPPQLWTIHLPSRTLLPREWYCPGAGGALPCWGCYSWAPCTAQQPQADKVLMGKSDSPMPGDRWHSSRREAGSMFQPPLPAGPCKSSFPSECRAAATGSGVGSAGAQSHQVGEKHTPCSCCANPSSPPPQVATAPHLQGEAAVQSC